MAFVSASDVETRIGNDRAVQLTTDSGSTVDTGLIDTYIAEAEADVLLAVRKRTSATITQADYPQTWAMIVGRTLAIAIYRLATRRPPVPEDWKTAYDYAIAWLEKLATGAVDLPDVEGNTPAESGFEREDADVTDML